MNQVPISAMFDCNYLKMSSGYNPSYAHFSRTLAVFVCILETLNKVLIAVLCISLSISWGLSY